MYIYLLYSVSTTLPARVHCLGPLHTVLHIYTIYHPFISFMAAVHIYRTMMPLAATKILTKLLLLPANTNIWHWTHQTLLQTPTSSADYTVHWVLPWGGIWWSKTREENVLVSRSTASTARHAQPNLSCKLEAITTVIIILCMLMLTSQFILQYSTVLINILPVARNWLQLQCSEVL